ncbi:MAG: PSD1 and planctomycete cytochrome C domain-containing protein [Planctomycetaceae bacterium]
MKSEIQRLPRMAVVSLWAVSTLLWPRTGASADEFFERRVRPVLVTRCIGCHGPRKQESGLRLDSRQRILKGADSGPVVDLKDVNKSRLLEVLTHAGSIKMPPQRKLPPSEMQAIRRWIAAGLPWPDRARHATDEPQRDPASHWAFQPVVRPVVPAVRDTHGARTDLDRFIQARLDDRGLAFAPRAEKITLIRRATFGLWGLPPTPDQVDQFLADRSENAFEQLVERLLSSPHYGELWGRHWLDVARYADNKGYVFFEEKKFPWAYTYRDYVIRALNEDLPYDQFIQHQLAADQLADEDHRWWLPAMGFLTLGARFMNNTHDIIDDRIDVMSRGMLGLTVTCARCHDHKFDPIPQADYYSLYGVFRSSSEPMVPPVFAPTPQSKAYQDFAEQLGQREKKLLAFIDRKYQELVSGARTRVAEYLMAVHRFRNQPPTDDFMLLTDKGALNPTMIRRWRIYLERAEQSTNPVWIPWHDLSKIKASEFRERSTEVVRGFQEDDRGNRLNRLLLESLSAAPLTSMQDVSQRYADVLLDIDRRWQDVCRRRAEESKPLPLRLDDSEAEQLRLVFYGKDAPPDIPKVMGWGFMNLLPDRPAQGEFKKLIKDVETWSTQGPAAPARAMVLNDNPRLHNPRVFVRGNANRLGVSVPRQFLGLLAPNRRPFQQGSGRLELAQAIASPQNPLTARVIVNRVWQHHFSMGLVSTAGDFGLRSADPSHPRLLDYLASDFVASGWSLKTLHRRVMNSAVYQQQSRDRPQPLAVDPENRLLWKFSSRRLQFEELRDALLAVSGGLQHRIGGPPVDVINGFTPRRTVYGFIDRMDLPGLFRTFDFPSPAVSSSGRAHTTVAPQALYLMNDGFIDGVSKRVAERTDIVGIKSVSGRVQGLYALVFSREPTDQEVQLAEKYLGNEPIDDDWKRYVHALLMTNEFSYID